LGVIPTLLLEQLAVQANVANGYELALAIAVINVLPLLSREVRLWARFMRSRR
jgi:hypothetical protein